MAMRHELTYRLFLLRRAIRRPAYTLPAGLGGAASVLLTLIHPVDIVFGLVPTAAYLYVGLEGVVLPFPDTIRRRFRAWFEEFGRLETLIPPDSGITLRGSSVDPEFLLTQLEAIKASGLGEAYFARFAAEIDEAFSITGRDIEQARRTRDRIRLGEISDRVRERTQQVSASAQTYKEAMNDVYTPSGTTEETSVRLGSEREGR
ncbi:MAG: hypothetical protein SFU56_16570 [Capsulimonadales bacterium]|nr:hypothetical protein [Capsulimonadales bacterium]